jgi:hypothetical protein
MSSRVTEIIQQVKRLPLSELRELRQILETVIEEANTPTPVGLMNEDEFEHHMEINGFLRRALPLVTNLTAYENYQPVKVQGRTLSEMIVEERR